MEPDVKLRCAKCRKRFSRTRREHRRRRKLGQTRFYCSLSCHISARNSRSTYGWRNLRRGKQTDALSPFRWFMARVRYRTKKGRTNLTTEYLASLWSTQKGICPLTGWALVLPTDTSGWKKLTPTSASLDRLNGSRGYVKGNVRFVSVMANFARYTFSDRQLLEFCVAVSHHLKVSR